MRTKSAKIRPVDPDPIYNSKTITKLINRVMKQGKKSIAMRQVYNALDIVKTKSKSDPIEVFDTAMQNITPKMEVRSRRVGGAAYQVPMPVRGSRAQSLTLRWLILEANKRSSRDHHTFADKLSAEILDAANNEGGAIQRKITNHKMAEANKAFAHFRW